MALQRVFAQHRALMSLLDLFKPKVNPIHQLSRDIFKQSVLAANELKKTVKDAGEELGTERWFAVLMEYQSMYMLVTDRAVFGDIPEEKRQKLMNEFVVLCVDTSVNTIFSGWGVERTEKMQKECMDNFKKSCVDYGHYKRLVPEKGQPPAGTMLWEFAKTIAVILGQEMDIAYIMAATAVVNLNALNFKKFIAYAKNQ